MIQESHIDKYLGSIEQELKDSFLKEEELLSYLGSDNFDVLNDGERKVMFFCCEVIFNTYNICHGAFPVIYMDNFYAHEEKNWTIREDSSSWEDCKNTFFEGYEEEDILAFVEDVLVDDEDNHMTDIGKEFIFILCKSYIDTITS
jgi:hypothetical protein